MKKKKKTNDRPRFDAARALRRRIGYTCHFTHPDTGEVIEGTLRRGRKVERVVGVRRIVEEGQGRGFDIDEQIFTVPRHVKITMGAAPRKAS